MISSQQPLLPSSDDIDAPREHNGSASKRAIRWAARILFVIYPISSGPVCGLAERVGWPWLAVPYFPLVWVTGFIPPLRIALMIWLMIWSPAHGRGMIG